MRVGCWVALILFLVPSVLEAQSRTGASQMQLEQMANRFAPTPLRVGLSSLSPGDRPALVKLIQAARIIDEIFIKQLWSGNPTLYQHLQKDTSSLGEARQHYFWINKGPWSEIDEYKAFLPGVPAHKPAGANFYPDDVTKAELESWFSALPDDQQQKAKGFFTVVRWKPGESGKRSDRSLISVPYSEEYKDDLTRAAGLLREASGLTDNASLKKFLNARADAFLSNDYYESDLAWMDLDAPLDIT